MGGCGGRGDDVGGDDGEGGGGGSEDDEGDGCIDIGGEGDAYTLGSGISLSPCRGNPGPATFPGLSLGVGMTLAVRPPVGSHRFGCFFISNLLTQRRRLAPARPAKRRL